MAAPPAELVLGDCTLQPALNRLSGPAGSVGVEPKVMLVLLALADADGLPLSRPELMARCWPGVFVGDDAVVRVAAEARRALATAGIRQLAIETIRKSGYRLVLSVPPVMAPPAPPPARALPRRAIITGGLAIAGAAAAWRWLARPDPATVAANALVAQARDDWRTGLFGDSRDGIAAAERAVALAPDHAAAWGMLALLQREWSENGGTDQAQPALDRCLAAIGRALALDGAQGDALAARAMIPPLFGDWLATGQRLHAVLDDVPGQPAALDALGVLHGSTGRMRDALAISAGQVQADPLAALYQHKYIYRLWANGEVQAMDRAADRALALWPANPNIGMARLWTYAYTGRAEAALRMLELPAFRQQMPAPMRGLFAATMTALASRRPADVATAIAQNRRFAPFGTGPAVIALQHLSALGAPDVALDVARGFLAGEGKAAVRPRPDPRVATSLNEQHRRKTLVLFVPATAGLRAQRGFLPLMERIGVADYWAKSGLQPDFLAS